MHLKYPRLKYSYHAEFLDDEQVLLLSEKKNTLLSGKLYVLLLAQIQREGLPFEELVNRLQGKLSAAEVIYGLNSLEKADYLTEAAPSLAPETCAYWNGIGLEPARLSRILKENPVSLETLGDLPSEHFYAAFEANGIETAPKARLRVVLSDDYEQPELEEINRNALATQEPWMLVKPLGVEIWIGPLFAPGKSACWSCLQQRLSNNRQMNTFYKTQTRSQENPPLPAAYTPLSLQLAANLAALEIIKWLYFEKNETLEGQILSLDSGSGERRTHRLVKRPQCLACGALKQIQADSEPLILKKRSSPCRSTQGGYREKAPEETLAHYQHHISPITGVVQTLEAYFPEAGSPVHNYVSGYNMALKSKSLLWLNHHLRGSNVGKGSTSAQAKAGALCEAIERYSCTYQGDEPCIESSLEELGERGIHPNACMNYSARQYQQRQQLNQDCGKFYFMVPVPFDTSRRIAWTPVYSLIDQRFKYLPSCFCYAQYPAGDERELFCYPDTNGNAAGNTREEAILQGFLELVERDSVALWWYNRLRKPAVDLASFDEPYFRQLTDYYHSLKRSLYVLDLTADLRIPAFAAVSSSLDESGQEPIFAFGAHVEAKIGIERALIELNQLLPIVNLPEAECADGRYRTRDAQFLEWLRNATIENQPYLRPSEDLPPKTAADYPLLCQPNVYDSVVYCLERAKKHGLETLVLDMTRPDVGLPVVKVIVPGLRHFWKRLAPGRLYNVPVKMGWLEAPLHEEELNPIGLFI